MDFKNIQTDNIDLEDIQMDNTNLIHIQKDDNQLQNNTTQVPLNNVNNISKKKMSFTCKLCKEKIFNETRTIRTYAFKMFCSKYV